MTVKGCYLVRAILSSISCIWYCCCGLSQNTCSHGQQRQVSIRFNASLNLLLCDPTSEENVQADSGGNNRASRTSEEREGARSTGHASPAPQLRTGCTSSSVSIGVPEEGGYPFVMSSCNSHKQAKRCEPGIWNSNRMASCGAEVLEGFSRTHHDLRWPARRGHRWLVLGE